MSLREESEQLSNEHWQNEQVQIRPVLTQHDLIYAACGCQLTEEQKKFVTPWFSIGRAYLSREDNYPCIIYSERNEPIGFISLLKWLGKGDAYSWSYYIDCRQQRKGYGKALPGLPSIFLNPQTRKNQSSWRQKRTTNWLTLCTPRWALKSWMRWM